jgi:hypothetical protein
LTTQYFVPEVVSIADACLGGLQGRSALLIGPEEQRRPYTLLLQQAGMKRIYQEDTPQRISSLLPQVQLLMHIPVSSEPYPPDHSHTLITAASIAQGCIRRRTPLLIFDLADSTSVEELAGLLPAVCLYTPEDIHRILPRTEVQIS